MASVSVNTYQLAAAANSLLEAAAREQIGADKFAQWAEQTADIMREEIPVDTGETRDSITVRSHGYGWKIGPTNKDDELRPIGVFIYYGTRGNPGDKFLDRTADRTLAYAPPIDVDGLL